MDVTQLPFSALRGMHRARGTGKLLELDDEPRLHNESGTTVASSSFTWFLAKQAQLAPPGS